MNPRPASLLFLSLLLGAPSLSRADLVLSKPSDPTVGFGLASRYGSLSSTTGPFFESLPAADGITGVKAWGDATYTSDFTEATRPSTAEISLNFVGAAEGTVSTDYVYVNYDLAFAASKAIPFEAEIRVVFFLWDVFDDVSGGVTQTFEAGMESTSGQFAVDLRKYQGASAFSYNVIVSARFDELSLTQGDTFTLSIPDNSIDVGVQGALNVVPEPSSIALVALGLPVGLALLRRRRAGSHPAPSPTEGRRFTPPALSRESTFTAVAVWLRP